MKDVELLRMLTQMRYALDRRRASPDDTYSLVLELVQSPSSIPASIVVIPAAGVEGMPFEFFDPRDSRQLGFVQRPARHDHEARLEHIAAIGGYRPTPRLIVPMRLFDSRLEAGLLVKMELFTDPLGMGEDLGAKEYLSFGI